MAELLRALAFLPLLLAAKIRREERRLLERLRQAKALAASSAITLEEPGTIGGWVRHRLLRNRVLGESAGDRYYLIESGYDAFRRRRRQRALVAFALLIIGVLIMLYTSGDTAP
jgi:hypothetical protein